MTAVSSPLLAGHYINSDGQSRPWVCVDGAAYNASDTELRLEGPFNQYGGGGRYVRYAIPGSMPVGVCGYELTAGASGATSTVDSIADAAAAPSPIGVPWGVVAAGLGLAFLVRRGR